MIKIRYASIRSLDISNGKGTGVALFVQGCHFRCYNCFNPDTWNFDGGKEWTKESENEFIKLMDKPYIQRISILGGEPLEEKNITTVFDFINKIHSMFFEKNIWLYTGYTWEQIFCDFNSVLNYSEEYYIKRQETVKFCSILVDGQYIDCKKNSKLKWRGSTNQRVIDVKNSLIQNRIIKLCD